jgi:hypothetical protein
MIAQQGRYAPAIENRHTGTGIGNEPDEDREFLHGRAEIVGDDGIVHHADVLTLKGNSYRLRNTDIDTLPSHQASDKAQ